MEKTFECKLCGDGIITCTLKVSGSFHNQEPPDICPYFVGIPFDAEWKVKEIPCLVCGELIKEQSRCIPNCKKEIKETSCSECYYLTRILQGEFVTTYCSKDGSGVQYPKPCPKFVKR